eukprot:4823077-Amphidinium_carterae.2
MAVERDGRHMQVLRVELGLVHPTSKGARTPRVTEEQEAGVRGDIHASIAVGTDLAACLRHAYSCT